MTDNSAARLCHVIKSDTFDGYGFNLHAEKGKTGQFIGKVDEGSPAESAGLRQGDHILEVNGVNITNETHKQVFERIKAVPNETRLLVIYLDDIVSKELTKDNSKQVEEKEKQEDNKPQKAAVTASSPATINNNTAPSLTVAVSAVPVPSVPVVPVVPVVKETEPTQVEKGSAHLDLRMTAAELRARLLAKKKYDPKKESLDLKKKYDIVQKL